MDLGFPVLQAIQALETLSFLASLLSLIIAICSLEPEGVRFQNALKNISFDIQNVYSNFPLHEMCYYVIDLKLIFCYSIQKP